MSSLYSLQLNAGRLEVFHGGLHFSFPTAFSVNGQVHTFDSCQKQGDLWICTGRHATLTIHCMEDAFTMAWELRSALPRCIDTCRVFTDGGHGLTLGSFDRAFSPQPRNNQGRNMEIFQHLPDISLAGYYSPPLLNFSLARGTDWVSIGLLDIPDSSQVRLEPLGDNEASFLLEACGGNKRVCDSYRPPRLLFTFPEDEWAGMRLFREKLIALGLHRSKKLPYSRLPGWWKNPIICTYGDELATFGLDDVDMIDPRFCADWVEKLADCIEQDWQIKSCTLVLDAFWQLRFALDPQVDTSRFGDMRTLVDRLHARGHRVLFWITPLFDSVVNGFVTRSQKLDVLSDREIDPLGVKGCRSLELTADNIATYFSQVFSVLLGDGEGQYNGDGVKMDYIGLLRDPALHGPYRNPAVGLGMTELLHFYKTVYAAAKAVKPDCLINCTVGDPRFENYIDINRLHDTHCGVLEKELRAQLSQAACPELPIDSDGAIMLTDWARRHYISAALYSIPSNYYSLGYHDMAPLPNEEKAALGRLFQLSAHRPDGTAVMRRSGCWELMNRDRVDGYTQDAQTVVYLPTPAQPQGFLFTWLRETILLPLHGRHIGQVEPAPLDIQPDYARDRVFIRLEPGVVYRFTDTDEKNGVEQMFSGVRRTAESTLNYAN